MFLILNSFKLGIKSLFQVLANLVLTRIELLTLLFVCSLYVRSFSLVDFVEAFATSVIARVVNAGPVSIFFQVKHIWVVRFISTLKTATLLQMQIRMASHSHHGVQRWIRNLHWLDVPDLLAVSDDGLVTAQITTFSEGGQTSFAELILVEENAINFLLGFAVRVIICHDKIFIVRHKILLNVLKMKSQRWVNFSKKATRFENFGQYFLKLLGILLLLGLLLIVVWPKEKCSSIAHEAFDSLVCAVFWTQQDRAVHDKFEGLGRTSLFSRKTELLIDV